MCLNEGHFFVVALMSIIDGIRTSFEILVCYDFLAFYVLKLTIPPFFLLNKFLIHQDIFLWLIQVPFK